MLFRSVTRRKKGEAAFPPGACVYRGGGLPADHIGFFEGMVGRKYRVPGFVATSFSEAKASEFYIRAYTERGQPAVLWRVHVDARGETSPAYRCMHVNLVQHSAVPGEEEYLFAPYSVFAVRSVTRGTGTARDPHVVDVDAALDNSEEPEDLPLAPWY